MPAYFLDPSELPSKEVAPGAEIRVACGEHLMFSFVRVAPGAIVPRHSHPHEQGGVCLEGAMEFTIGDETRIVTQGQGWMIPGGTAHAVKGLEQGAFVLDVFYPQREEYK